MNEILLAYYMGYAFCHGVNVQHLLAPKELTVPYVIYWDSKVPKAIPYPASSQEDAVASARSARRQVHDVTGWSSGREGFVTQKDGTQLDALVVEGWVPSLDVPLEVFVYYRKSPFRLIYGFFWKANPQARKDVQAFAAEFQRGIQAHPFGEQCMNDVQNAERVQFSR